MHICGLTLSIRAGMAETESLGWLAGDSEMADRIRTFDWTASPLGPSDLWPVSLRTALNLLIDSAQPIFLAWGKDLISFYNDAFIPIIGARHADGLGMPCAAFWAEIWEEFRSPVNSALAGQGQFVADRLVSLPNRLERAMGWFSFSITPLRDDDGQIGGIFCVSMETTEKVLAKTDSQTHLQLAQDTFGIGVWEWKLQTGEMVWTEALYGLLGIDPGFPPSDELIYKYIHPEDVARVRQAIVRTERYGVPYEEEFRILRADGQLRYLAGRGRLISDAEGRPVSIIGLNYDVTERKAGEQRQQLLMREVDHRAKNILAIVKALVGLTRADSKEAFAEAIQGRVAALARSHSLLAKSRWRGARLHALIAEELKPYLGDGDDDRMRLIGPPTTLEAGATQPLAMVFHELATNAAKYGSLSVPWGNVDICWVVGAEMVEFSWKESGGPAIQAPKRTGFGSTLIGGTVLKQLDGSIDFDWRPEGLHCRFSVAAANFSWGPAVAMRLRPPKAKPVRGGIEGRRILIVEDDVVSASSLAQSLRELGGIPIGPVTSLEQARTLVAVRRLDAAVLEMNLRGSDIWPVAEMLRARRIPYLYATAVGDPGGGTHDAPVLEKPLQADILRSALQTLVQ